MRWSRFLVDPGPLRTSPEFRRLFAGFGGAQIGAQLGIVAIAVQIYTITGSSLDVGLVSLAQLVPAFLGSVLGGSVADAMDRRKVLLVTESAMALCAAGMAVNAMGHHPKLWPIYVLASLSAGFSGCDGPTRVAVLVTMVEPEQFVSANALRQVLQQVSVVVGPAIGGLMLGLAGVAPVFWGNAVLVLCALVSVLSIGPRPPLGGGTRFGWSSIAEGFAFLKGRQAIQGCFVADLNAMVLGMPTALFPALGLVHFHGGKGTVGLLYAAPGVGALVISLLSGWANHIRRLGLAVCIAVGIWGIAIAAFGLVGNLPVALLLLAVAGAADVISAVFRSTIIQTEAPDRLRGRLSSLQTAVVTGGPRLGNTEAGVVASLAGTQFSVVSGGLGCVLGIALVARFMPRFVNYQLPGWTRSGTAATDAENTMTVDETTPPTL